MPASPMRRTKLVAFRKRTQTRGGEFDDYVWANVSEAWVSISPDRGREALSAGETLASVVYSVRGDYLDLEKVTEDMPMIFNPEHSYEGAMPGNTVVYEIKAVMPDEEFNEDILLKVIRSNRPLANIK